MEGFVILFIGVFMYIVIKGMSEYVSNENSPLVDEKAELIKKRRHSHQNNTSYYLTFQVDGGESFKCRVPRRIYKEVEEGERGVLNHQGTRFYRFTTANGVIEK